MGSSYAGFWSYAHKDDDSERGRIVQLARDLVAQYEMITGDDIELFLDKDVLNWGENWREKLDEYLDSSGFLIPVWTPRYFSQPECRSEFRRFVIDAKRLGIEELLLPIYYVTIPSLHDDSMDDELIIIAREIQWQDWRELRFKDRDSEEYRSAVGKLASQLATANNEAEQRQRRSLTSEEGSSIEITTSGVDGKSGDGKDDEPGTIDRLATSETELPKWAGTINDINENIERIGALFTNARDDVERASGRSSFSERVKIARRLAVDLSRPTGEISRLVGQYISQATSVDYGVRLLLKQIPIEIENDPELSEEYCTFISTVKEMCESASIGFEAIEAMVNSIGPIEKMSRDLRPVLRQLRKSLTTMSEGKSITEGWMNLIRASGVDCAES